MGAVQAFRMAGCTCCNGEHEVEILRRFGAAALAAGVSALVVGCGGGDSSGATDISAQRTVAQAEVPLAVRKAAATRTANSTTNACANIAPFYWEVGGRNGALVSGSRTGAGAAYTAGSGMNLASASKWIYSAYTLQRQAGVLSETDLKHLQLRSGYTHFGVCYPYQTVRGCLNYADNNLYEPAHDGLFVYDGGHMQKHAVMSGLGTQDRRELTDEVMAQIGPGLPLQYGVPALAGGGYGTPRGYAEFLRRMMRDELVMGSWLGSHPICTNPSVCPDQAVRSPNPDSESWHYSVGHWIEDDPVVGDGAYSSPGSKGFYPWIDAGKQFYGLVAREAEFGYFPSVSCGRLIRTAWMSGTTQ